MSIKAGLVGLPNVGKSTLFNALTKSCIPAENYPFCTIEPHVAITQVPDQRIAKLQQLYDSKKTIPATVQFVDIAGLVKGAASGEGLGNQFLGHIRQVDLIIHVLRCFEDPNIIYSGQEEEIDPIGDFEIILSELMLKDLESVEKRLAKIDQLLKGAQNKPAEKKVLEAEKALLIKIQDALNSFNAEKIRNLLAESSIETIPLLSAKDFLIVANIDEHEIEDEKYKENKYFKKILEHFGSNRVIPVCAKLEYELIQLDDEEADEIMSMVGLKERALDNVIRKTYKNLGLITFFTCGPQEIHAWPIKKGITVRKAAGQIHSDLERGFICADVFGCKDLFEIGSLTKLREMGKIKTEGQDYLVHDGDIIHVKFNV